MRHGGSIWWMFAVSALVACSESPEPGPAGASGSNGGFAGVGAQAAGAQAAGAQVAGAQSMAASGSAAMVGPTAGGGAAAAGMPAAAGTSAGGLPGTAGMPSTGGGAAGAMATAGEAAAGGPPNAGGTAGGTPSMGDSSASDASTMEDMRDEQPDAGEPSEGSITCPSPALPAGDTNETVQVGSSSRSYILHVPSAYDGTEPVPLVVDFHPLGGSGRSERMGSPYPALTDSEGVIMAFPSGESGPLGGAWNVGPCCVANVDDVAFARALVPQVQERACIDPKRIYAVGFSMGGGMSHYVACHAADLFAAVAPAAFDLTEENAGDCVPARPITLVSFRGTSDPIVPYGGGYSAVVPGMPVTFLGARGTFEKWGSLNGCTGTPTAEDANGCTAYPDCQDGVELMLCTKQGGGHEPGNAPVAWPILKSHTLP